MGPRREDHNGAGPVSALVDDRSHMSKIWPGILARASVHYFLLSITKELTTLDKVVPSLV